MQLICDYKEVTFEMLNDVEFVGLIEKRFPKERFAKLYWEEETIGTR